MVTHINFAVDDDVADRAKELKSDLSLSWPGFFEEAIDCLENHHE